MSGKPDSAIAASRAGAPECGGEHSVDVAGAFNPIRIDEQKCVRCDLCDWICPGDLIYHAEGDKTKLPVVVYPDECWYCGLCQSICPTQAIEVIFPQRMLRNRTDVVELLGKVEE